VTWGGPDGSLWQRIFDFGTSTTGEDYSDGGANQHYIFLTPWSGAGTLRCGYRDGPTAIERNLEGPVLPVGTESHIAVVWGAAGGQGGGAGPFGTTVSLYLNGLEVARDTAAHITLDSISDLNNWLGRSQWPDPMLTGGMNEFRIYDYALTPGEVLGNFQAGADTVNFEGGPPPPEFLRGDTTGEGTLNITDGVNIFNWLFLGGQTPGCLEAANPNDGAVINITSGVYLLNFLFLGGPSPPAPGPPTTGGGTPCGPDPVGSPSNLGCLQYNGC
jgi:hypothetical protein